jgi:hypothetical protein
LRARADWSRFLLTEVTRGGQIIVWRYDGAWTALGQSVVTLSAGQTDVLSTVAYGSTIAVRWNGVDQFSVQDVNDAAGTRAGIYFGTYSVGGARPTLDNFGVQVTAAAPPAPVAPVAAGNCNAAVNGASDFFNRTPPTGSLGCANGTGQAWVSPSDSAWTICATAYGCAIAPAGGEAWASLETHLTSQRVTAQLRARSAAAQGMGAVVARMTDYSSDLLWAGLAPDGTVDVWILSGGVWTQAPGAPVTTPYTSNVSRKLDLTVSGSLMRVYVDDALVYGPYDVGAAPAGATRAGMYAALADPAATSWPQFDSFAVASGPP